MRNVLAIVYLFSLITISFGQSHDYNFNRKICFSNFNGALFIDTNNMVYSQTYLDCSLNIKFDSFASEKQIQKILENSVNATTGTFFSVPPKPYHYMLTSTFQLNDDTFKLVKRKIEKLKELYIGVNENISSKLWVEDSLEFIELRNSCDISLLKYIQDNELIVKTIYKDIDEDNEDEILLIASDVFIGQQDRATEAGGTDYSIQILKKKSGHYETIFIYNEPPENLFFADLIKFKGQKNYSIVLKGVGGMRDFYSKLEILTIGDSTLDNCVQELSY